MFQKIVKNSMSISLQTYDKTGGVHNFGNQYEQVRVTKIFVFVKKSIGFYARPLYPGFDRTEPHEER